jgi:peptide/nickel transport system ATP-binding protein
MLRGEIVEMGSVEKVLDYPLHPYTQLLKASIPVPNPADKWESEIALSDLETREYSRVGCKFSGRCPRAKAICRECEPENYQVDERYVKCHLYR